MLLHHFILWVWVPEGCVQDIKNLESAVDILMPAAHNRLRLSAISAHCSDGVLEPVVTLASTINFNTFIISQESE